jgi:predicted MFS family arabinose efflux permease
MFINVPIGIAVLATVRRFVDETPRRPGRFDVVGAISATAAAVSIVWALIGAPQHGWGSVRTVVGLLAGVLLVAVLALTEARHPHPLLRPSLLRSRRRVTALIATATMVGAQFPLFFIGVQYLENQRGFGPVGTGLAFLPTTLGIFLISRVTPRLVGRFGPAPLAITGTAGIALSSYLLSGLDGTGPYVATVFVPFLINGIAAGLSFMPLTVLVLSDVEREHAGSASGLLQTMQQLGGSIGLAVVASVYAAHAVPGSFLPGVREAFLASVAMAAIALIAVATLVVRRPRPAPVAELD